jgi:hypothetical protein
MLLAGVGLSLSGTAAAEDVPYAAIRFERELGVIQITTGYADRSPDLQSRAGAMEKSGIVLLEADKDRTFTRKISVGSHAVDITISIAPPVGHGEGGGSSRALIRAVMGRDTLVDCPLFNGPIGLDRLTIDPERRFVSVSAADGILHFDGFESKQVVDEDWLDEKAELTRKLLCGSK